MCNNSSTGLLLNFIDNIHKFDYGHNTSNQPECLCVCGVRNIFPTLVDGV